MTRSALKIDNKEAERSARALLAARTLRMEAKVGFSSYSAEQVFDIMGDPARITDWYLLAKSVRLGNAAAADQPFVVDFTLFGEVTEQMLFWDRLKDLEFQWVLEVPMLLTLLRSRITRDLCQGVLLEEQ